MDNSVFPLRSLWLCGEKWACFLCVFLVLGFLSCNRQKVDSRSLVEESPVAASTVSMAGARFSSQLVSGFYPVEEQSWRWTARQFVVALRTPPGAAQSGATLELDLYLPSLVIDKLKTLTLSANVNGAVLAPETWSQSGKYVYKRPVPAEALTADAVQARFSLDKALPPEGQEERELGIVVMSAGLNAQ